MEEVQEEEEKSSITSVHTFFMSRLDMKTRTAHLMKAGGRGLVDVNFGTCLPLQVMKRSIMERIQPGEDDVQMI